MVAPPASWSTSVTCVVMQDTMQRRCAGECRSKKRAFGHADDSQLTMLRLYRGLLALDEAPESALIRTLQPTGNKVGIGTSVVPNSAVASARRRPPQWRRAPAISHACNLDPVEIIAAIASGSKALYRQKLDQLVLAGHVGPATLSKALAVALVCDTRDPSDPESLFGMNAT